MSKHKENIYERLAADLGKWYKPTVERLAVDIRGGKRPPWTIKLTGQQKRDYFMSLPDARKLDLVQQMNEQERAELRKILDAGGGIDAGPYSNDPEEANTGWRNDYAAW